MIHLFYIHSHTTYLTVLGTINHLHLNPSEVVFAFSRNYETSLDGTLKFKVLELSNTFTELNSINRMKAAKIRKIIPKVDAILDTITSDYLLYVPHLGFSLMQMVATNKKCKAVRFIEEGSCCYSPKMQLTENSFKEIILRFYSKFFIGSSRFWVTDFIFDDRNILGRYDLPVETYGIDKSTFEFLSYKKNIVTWPISAVARDLNQAWPIFIFDAAIEHKFASFKSYFNMLKSAIKNESRETNYIKFHPGQTQINRRKILEIFAENNGVIVELPNDVPFEILLSNYSNLKVVGSGSSLLLYAKKLGHTVISYENELMDDEMYKKYKKIYDFVI